MELPGHAEEVQRQVAGILRRHREVVVAPATGGQRFQFQVAEVGENIVPAARNMPGVVEDRHVGAERLGRFRGALVVFFQRQTGGLPAVLLLLRIESVGLHEVQTPATARLVLADDVEEDAVAVGKEPHRLADLLAEVVQIRPVEIQRAERCLENTRVPVREASLLVHFPPIRVLFCGEVIHAGREIDRGVDPCLLGRLVLGSQQVEGKIRMHLPDRCRVIAPAVMALREERDRIDRRLFQRFLPALLVELLTDAGNVRRGVEVEVDLAVSESVILGMHGDSG